MKYYTYHDLKVNTNQIAYTNRIGGGQFLTLKFDPMLIVNITYRYLWFKNGEMANLFISTAKDGKGGEGRVVKFQRWSLATYIMIYLWFNCENGVIAYLLLHQCRGFNVEIWPPHPLIEINVS